jgi:hypothetical protein
MVAVPALIPVTCPVVVPMVAMFVFNDDQYPPGELDRVMYRPTPTAVGPVIRAGAGFTVISVPVREQPLGEV